MLCMEIREVFKTHNDTVMTANLIALPQKGLKAGQGG